MSRSGPSEDWDVVLVGGGIMSATLGVLLSEVEPDWRILVVERLDEPALESSGAWNNAGTGHAGLCEFNYTPRWPDGTVDVSSAVRIGEQFGSSLLFWSHLVEDGLLGPPEAFIRSVPHLGFGRGADGVAYLRARWEALRGHPLFSGLEFSQDPDVPVLVAAVRDNRSLVTYLARQVTQFADARTAALHRFVPSARADDWTLMTAGQRVQVLKKTGDRGTMVGFGTEMVNSAGGSLAAVPGASTVASTMLHVLAASFPKRMPEWAPRLDRLAPSTEAVRELGPDRLDEVVTRTRRVLGLVPVSMGAAAS